MKKLATLLVLALAFGVNPVWALDAPIDESLAKVADHESYLVKTPGMLMHGLYEIGEAPLEGLHQPFDKTVTKKDYTLGLFKGLNDGIFNVLEGMTRGTFNLVRAFAPGMGRYEKRDTQKKLLPGLAS
jgi:hypothetical protein